VLSARVFGLKLEIPWLRTTDRSHSIVMIETWARAWTAGTAENWLRNRAGYRETSRSAGRHHSMLRAKVLAQARGHVPAISRDRAPAPRRTRSVCSIPRGGGADGGSTYQSSRAHSPRHTILIDTCPGEAKGTRPLTTFPSNLGSTISTQAAGPSRTSTHVFCTHLHFDHPGLEHVASPMADGRRPSRNAK